MVSGGNGNEIIVNGVRNDPWVTSISGEALMGIQGDAWTPSGTTLTAVPGDGGGAAPTFTPTPPAQITGIDVNEDSETQELLEDVVENFLQDSDANGADWAVEYHEQSGEYVAQSNDGREALVSSEQAAIIFDQTMT